MIWSDDGSLIEALRRAVNSPRVAVVEIVGVLSGLGGVVAGGVAALIAAAVLTPTEPVTAAQITAMAVGYGLVAGLAGSALGIFVAFGALRRVPLGRFVLCTNVGVAAGLTAGWLGGPWAWHHMGFLGAVGFAGGALLARGLSRGTPVPSSSQEFARPLLIAGVALALGTHTSSAQTTYRQADVDATGQLRIVLANAHVIRPPKDSDQVAFEQVAMSADHRSVGWVALYPNCCTSYPIPLKLVLLRTDGGRTVISNDLPIWQWAFAADGENVVIRQAPVHGAAPMMYELRDIRTGRVIATAQSDSTTPPTALPAWACGAMPRPRPS